jgi:hypothetical protein
MEGFSSDVDFGVNYADRTKEKNSSRATSG